MKLLTTILFLFFIQNLVYSQNAKIQETEDYITYRIDSVFKEMNISVNKVIVDFESFLVSNNFCSKSNLESGYINFYNYLSDPSNSNFEIKHKLEHGLIIDTFKNKYGSILNQYLQIDESSYTFLDSENLLKKVIDYSNFVLMSGETSALNFDLSKYEHDLNKDLYKVFLITVLRVYSNFDYIVKGIKCYSPAFVDTLVKSELLDNRRIWIKIKKVYKSQDSNQFEYKLLDSNKSNENNITNKTEDYINLRFIINRNGKVSKYEILESNNNKLNKIAVKYIEENEWIAAKKNNNFVDCVLIKHVRFYKGNNVNNAL